MKISIIINWLQRIVSYWEIVIKVQLCAQRIQVSIFSIRSRMEDAILSKVSLKKTSLVLSYLLKTHSPNLATFKNQTSLFQERTLAQIQMSPLAVDLLRKCSKRDSALVWEINSVTNLASITATWSSKIAPKILTPYLVVNASLITKPP